MPRFVAANESDPLLGSARAAPTPSYSEQSFKRRKERAGPHCCTVCCTILSFVSTFFLIWIGTYAAIGWNYQHGGWTKAQAYNVQTNAWTAAFLWALTGLVSLWFWRRSRLRDDILDREVGIVRPHDE